MTPIATAGLVGFVGLLTIVFIFTSRIVIGDRITGTHPSLSTYWARFSLWLTAGCYLADFLTDVFYVGTQPFASFVLWVAACCALAAPSVVFLLWSGLLRHTVSHGIPRMLKAARTHIPRQWRRLWESADARLLCLPLTGLVVVLYLLLKPVLCLVLLVLVVNLKLVIFPELMSRLVDYVGHERPEANDAVMIDIAPNNPSPASSDGSDAQPRTPTKPKVVRSPSASLDEADNVFRLNLAFLSAAFFRSMPQLGITLANNISLEQSSAGAGFSVLALVSIGFSALVTLLQLYRITEWRSRYGWRMDLRMPVYPVSDSQVQRLTLVANLYKSSTALTSTVWAPEASLGKRQTTTTMWDSGLDDKDDYVPAANYKEPISYMAAVTTSHHTKKAGWLSLQVGQVVNVLFENPASDEVFVKVLVDGRQGSFPMHCVTMNDTKQLSPTLAATSSSKQPSPTLAATSSTLAAAGSEPAGTDVEIELPEVSKPQSVLDEAKRVGIEPLSSGVALGLRPPSKATLPTEPSSMAPIVEKRPSREELREEPKAPSNLTLADRLNAPLDFGALGPAIKKDAPLDFGALGPNMVQKKQTSSGDLMGAMLERKQTSSGGDLMGAMLERKQTSSGGDLMGAMLERKQTASKASLSPGGSAMGPPAEKPPPRQAAQAFLSTERSVKRAVSESLPADGPVAGNRAKRTTSANNPNKYNERIDRARATNACMAAMQTQHM